MESAKKTPGQTYSAARIELDFTQKQLAEKLGVSIRTIKLREAGDVTIDNEAWLAITSLAHNQPEQT